MGWPRTVQFYVPENFDHLRLMYNRPDRRGIEVTERLTPAMCHNRPMLSYRENSLEATCLALNVKKNNFSLFRVSFIFSFLAISIFCRCFALLRRQLICVFVFIFVSVQMIRSIVFSLCTILLSISRVLLYAPKVFRDFSTSLTNMLDSLVSALLLLTHTLNEQIMAALFATYMFLARVLHK